MGLLRRFINFLFWPFSPFSSNNNNNNNEDGGFFPSNNSNSSLLQYGSIFTQLFVFMTLLSAIMALLLAMLAFFTAIATVLILFLWKNFVINSGRDGHERLQRLTGVDGCMLIDRPNNRFVIPIVLITDKVYL